MTSTTNEIVPIVEVEGIKIGPGKPGELTNTLYKQFQQRIHFTEKGIERHNIFEIEW